MMRSFELMLVVKSYKISHIETFLVGSIALPREMGSTKSVQLLFLKCIKHMD